MTDLFEEIYRLVMLLPDWKVPLAPVLFVLYMAIAATELVWWCKR